VGFLWINPQTLGPTKRLALLLGHRPTRYKIQWSPRWYAPAPKTEFSLHLSSCLLMFCGT